MSASSDWDDVYVAGGAVTQAPDYFVQRGKGTHLVRWLREEGDVCVRHIVTFGIKDHVGAVNLPKANVRYHREHHSYEFEVLAALLPLAREVVLQACTVLAILANVIGHGPQPA